MKKLTVALIGASILWGVGGVAFAQTLSNRDQLFLFYNYYQNQKNSQQIQKQQMAEQKQLLQLQQQQDVMARNAEVVSDPNRRYARSTGKNSPVVEREINDRPAIYGGRGGQRQYFMRNTYFNTRR